ncbi:hydroxyacid dehydrogenase [Kushneria aurantia]|uniref:hydroxyacid dehydrogenase n=1 Tax=Kushneria aurantia TaxID=504092 RepID=UPI0003684790|nr:hydroxyacid dehydrogenase [Kushneria aurantia]
MPNTILVTGPHLASEARSIAEKAGYCIVHMPAYPSEQTLVNYIERHDPVGVVSRMGNFGAGAIKAARSLKVISKHGAGVDNIDVVAATANNIQVIRAAGGNAVSVAEHTLAMIMARVKQLAPLDKGMRQGRWEKAGFVGRELAGMRLGLIGAGAIAGVVVRLAHGLGFKIAVYDPYASAQAIEALGVERIDELETLLECSDVVSLHCPLTDASRHLLNAETLRLMPSGSYVVNTSRGGLIDEQALLEALDSGHIAGAGLDTFEQEPPAEVSPLMRSDRVILSPHVAGVTAEAGTRVGILAVEGIVDLLAGRTLAANRLINDVSLQAQQSA